MVLCFKLYRRVVKNKIVTKNLLSAKPNKPGQKFRDPATDTMLSATAVATKMENGISSQMFATYMTE